MAAELELQGVIKLTADTTAVEKKVEAVEKGEKATGGDSTKKAAEDAGKAAEAAAKAMGKKITDTINTIFGSFGKTATGTFTNVSNLFGNVGSLLGKGAAGAAGTAGAGAAVGGSGAGAGMGAGGAAGAAAALPALGPIGIGIAAVAALGAVSLGVVAVFKAITEKLIDFGRTLSAFSPSMAITFAQFDRQIMIIKQRMGEMLAPALEKLLDAVLNLVDFIAPYVVFFVSEASKVIAAIINFEVAVGRAEEVLVKMAASIAKGFLGGVALGLGIPGLPGLVSGVAGGVAGGGAGIGVGPVLGQMGEDLKRFIEEWRRDKARAASGMVMTEFMNRINADGSAQRQYQDEFRQLGPGSPYHAANPIPRKP